MSTRALRKLQREREHEKQLATLKAEGEDDGTEGSEEESIPFAVQVGIKKKRKNKLNVFQMLEEAERDEEGEEGEEVVPDSESDKASLQPEAHDTPGTSTPQSTKPKRKKKRKVKDKGKEREPAAISKVDADGLKKASVVDEIDLALRELDMRKGLDASQHDQGQDSQAGHSENSWETNVSKLLAVDSKHLNPTTEMRSLFGSIALQRATRNQGRPDEEGRVDLETVLSGRHSPVSRGKELGSLAKRRNIFMQGQENWPLATSGGLGMEFVKEPTDSASQSSSTSTFGKHYEIVHNSAYQDTQQQFRQAVESMSAENMIHLLMFHPYHIATLLQVAEIAKHQGDHSVTGDLLERALFAFGRSVHSTFGVSVREGRARLSFEKSANRELYLAIWRYIQNLEMRGTWRTAFEWSKMLLSFNILSDPYGITHALDQYALRGRQHDALIALCSESAFGNTWSHLPNMQISLALAYHRAGQPKLARQKLALAMNRYPYILSHLCSTLEISPPPKSLWGYTPSTDAEKFYTELYVTRAKDLWATPETTALLVEVAETLDSYMELWKRSAPAPELEVSLEDARHILLLDIPALIALIPRNFRTLPTAQYDVLPPPSSANDAGLTARAPATADGPEQRGPGFLIGEFLRAASRRLFGGTAERNDENHPLEREYEINAENLFDSLADANISEADRNAILGALADDTDTDSDQDQPDGEENTTSNPANAGASANTAQASNQPSPTSHRPSAGPATAIATATTSPPHTHRPPSPFIEDETDEELPVPPQPPQPHPPPQTSEPHHPTNPPDETDPQRIQRHLLSAGLNDLLSNKPGAMTDYVKKLKLLRHRDREWTLSVLKQRLAASGSDAVLVESITEAIATGGAG